MPVDDGMEDITPKPSNIIVPPVTPVAEPPQSNEAVILAALP
jgi:hypothetical protein